MKNLQSNWNKVLSSLAALMAGIGMLVVAGSGPALANGLGAGIVDSPHDFASGTPASWNFRGEICRTCHVPHDHGRTNSTVIEGLLWNHAVSAETYTLYSSPTLEGAQDAQPTGISKLCLGCHDGTVGLGAFDKQAVSHLSTAPFIQDVDAGFQVPNLPLDGTNLDLRGTHPISIIYDDTLTTKLKDPAATAMGTSGFIDDVLEGGKVQCSSCHDVHDQEAVADTHLLRVTTKNPDPSGLCLTCHIK